MREKEKVLSLITCVKRERERVTERESEREKEKVFSLITCVKRESQ